jgi:hypothetical protein
MAGHASFHGNGHFLGRDGIMLCYRAVTHAAVNSRFAVARMAEDYKVFDNVDMLRRKWRRAVAQRGHPPDLRALLPHRAMAVHALRHRRKRGFLAGFDRRVATAALDLQRRVLLMAEMNGFVRECQRR